jgi:RecA/RadA recombinase
VAFHGSEKCTNCSCSYIYHYHSNCKFVEKEETLEEVIEDMKNKYLNAVANKKVEDKKLFGHALTKQSVEFQIDEICKAVNLTCRRLKQLCSGFNFVDELAIMIYQLKRDASMLRSSVARATADKFIKIIEEISDSLNREEINANHNKYSQNHKEEDDDYSTIKSKKLGIFKKINHFIFSKKQHRGVTYAVGESSVPVKIYTCAV